MDIEPIGVVRKTSEDESAIELDARHADGLHGLAEGDRLEVLYWMHGLPDRDRKAMRVHPRGDRSRPKKGVFGLRSPMRPNPIGASVVELLRVRGSRLSVRDLDALDGSPVLDVKSARSPPGAKTLIGLWGGMHNAIFAALDSRFGEERVKDALCQVLRRVGREAAKTQRADAIDIGRAIAAMEKLWGIEGRIVEERADRFVREVTRCPWSYFTPLGCKAFAWWMEGFCRGSNGAYAYSLERLIPDGHEHCRWSVRRRTAPAQRLPRGRAGGSGPAGRGTGRA